MSVPPDHAAARVALDDGERLARILEFARTDTGALLRDADSRRAARSPEERRAAAEAALRTRRQAARAVVGDRAPEWLAELVAHRGTESVFGGPDGALLKLANGIAFGEERTVALRQLADYLLACGVSAPMALTFVGAWANTFAAPVPNEQEILQAVARVVEQRQRTRRRA